jgi:drug/metabolite transporter (DMT)-like permease
VVAYFFLRERLTHVQVVGVAAIVVGVSILSALRVG